MKNSKLKQENQNSEDNLNQSPVTQAQEQSANQKKISPSFFNRFVTCSVEARKFQKRDHDFDPGTGAGGLVC